MAIAEDDVRDIIDRVVYAWKQYQDFLTDTGGEHFTGSTSSLEHDFRTQIHDEFTNRVGIEAGFEGLRSLLAGAEEEFSNVFDQAIVEYARYLNLVETDVDTILRRMYDDFIDRTQTVRSRGFTHNDPGAIAGGGNGVVYKFHVMPNGDVIENSHAETKTIRCIQDGGSGSTIHEELFEIVGQDAERDDINRIGSGSSTTLSAVSGLSTSQLIENPSFDEGTSGTDLTGWTFLSGSLASNTAIGSTSPAPYRTYFGAASSNRLEFTTGGDVTIEQDLIDRGISFRSDTPVFLSLRVYVPAVLSGGTLTITLGDQSHAVTLTSLTDDTWTTVIFGSGSQTAGGTKNWFDNFRTSGELKLKIASASLAGGSVYIDDLCMQEFHPFDGSWWAILGGSNAFVQDDEATCADTSTDAGMLQTFLFKKKGFFFPHLGAAETWSDPTGTP